MSLLLIINKAKVICYLDLASHSYEPCVVATETSHTKCDQITKHVIL